MTMVVGVGVDLVETVRVKRLLERYSERFIQKLMDPEEARHLPVADPERTLALALAIAGKEAASKALGTGWSRGVFWRDVVVTRVPEPAASRYAASGHEPILASAASAFLPMIFH